MPHLSDPWPSDRDVLRAFKAFDSEGLGFIKVTLLKRFLVQAQLDVEDSVCEFIYTLHNCKRYHHDIYWTHTYTVERLIRDNCTIDGDDLINYEGSFNLTHYYNRLLY